MNKENLDHDVSFYSKPQVGFFYCADYAIIWGTSNLKFARIKANQNHPKGNCICMDQIENIPETEKLNGEDKSAPAGESYNFSVVEKIEEILPALKEQTFMSEEWKKNRRIKLFNDRHFHAKYLIKKNENGTYDYEKMIEYIHFIEEARKDLAAIHQAYELAKRWHIENENIAAREAIKEADKKYQPKVKEEKEKKQKESTSRLDYLCNSYGIGKAEAQKFDNIMKLGIAEDAAAGILKLTKKG